MVQTALGAVDAKTLGYTLMHEHLAMIDPAMTRAFPDWLDLDRLEEIAKPQLERLYELGIRTIIDATPINLGRDLRVIERIASLSKIKIIASTGLYHFEAPWVCDPNPEWVARMYLREIRDGMQGTSIRPGVIKCATDEKGVTDWNRALLKAAAIASSESGLPILTHSDAQRQNGLHQLKALLAYGVKPERLVIGHCGDSNDLDYLQRLLDHGCYLGMDRFGIEQFNRMEDRIETLTALLRRGYASQLMLSHDCHFYSDHWRVWHRERYQPQPPERNMRMISEIVLPRLLENGIAQSDIDRMMCTNIQRLFEE